MTEGEARGRGSPVNGAHAPQNNQKLIKPHAATKSGAVPAHVQPEHVQPEIKEERAVVSSCALRRGHVDKSASVPARPRNSFSNERELARQQTTSSQQSHERPAAAPREPATDGRSAGDTAESAAAAYTRASSAAAACADERRSFAGRRQAAADTVQRAE